MTDHNSVDTGPKCTGVGAGRRGRGAEWHGFGSRYLSDLENISSSGEEQGHGDGDGDVAGQKFCNTGDEACKA